MPRWNNEHCGFQKGHLGLRGNGWNQTENTKNKISIAQKGIPRILQREEHHGMWKGNEVGYHGIHKWVYKKLGKKNNCEYCGKESKWIDWANRSHEYKRELTDWIALCRSCHRYYDFGKINI